VVRATIVYKDPQLRTRPIEVPHLTPTLVLPFLGDTPVGWDTTLVDSVPLREETYELRTLDWDGHRRYFYVPPGMGADEALRRVFG
jgi:hypothetical protein